MIIGIFFVIIFLSVLVLCHELGHFLAAKKFGLLVEEFGFGLPPRVWGKKIGETIYSVNALPFGGFVKICGEDEAQNTSARSFGSLKIWRRMLIIAAGVFMNFLLGWLVISIVFSIGLPRSIVITEIFPNSPAEQIGLMAGDRIMGTSVNNFIKFTNDNRGREIDLKIERDGEVKEFSVVPRIDPPANEGALGIGLVEIGLERQNIFSSIWEGLKTSLQIVQLFFLFIFDIFRQIFTTGSANLAGISGPVGIVKTTAQAGTLGFAYLLQLLALISLNLVVINILPFPALDGGRLLFLFIEKIKGSPLPVKFERYANSIGMALLLILMAAITVRDIIRF